MEQTTKNATGQRLGHTAAELRLLRMTVNNRADQVERLLQQFMADQRQRDQQLALLLQQVEAGLVGLTKYIADQESHRNGQLDHVLNRMQATLDQVAKQLQPAT